MDELAEARKRKLERQSRNDTDRDPDLHMDIWHHPDGSTTRQVGVSSRFSFGDKRGESEVLDHLLGGIMDVSNDFAEDERHPDSWEHQPITMVYFNRAGARYIVMHEFYNDECVSWRGRLGLAWFMFRRTLLMLSWGWQLIKLAFTYKP
jgi:hypothetical protein